MTDERAKEIAEHLRRYADGGDATLFPPQRVFASFLLHLYDDIQSIKASLSGLSFLNAGIQPVRKVDR
jgi:hypothetical protein